MPQETQQYSNKISVEKFIFYLIISLGIYQIVWFYRNWKFFKEKETYQFFYLLKIYNVRISVDCSYLIPLFNLKFSVTRYVST